MRLYDPIAISSRLLPCVKIADCTLSVEPIGSTEDGRIVFRFFFDRPGKKTYVDENLKSGCGERWNEKGCREAFRSMVSFLSAAVESREYRERIGKPYSSDSDSNENLFPRFIVRFFSENSSELDSVSIDLES